MKSIVIIGIVLAGIIGSIAVFVSIDSEVWQDKRTGTIGVASPDEIDEKINCLSEGGVWDVGGCNAKPVELENPDVVVQSINNFEGCIAAGNPAMESYPRQCRTMDGQHFVEILDEPSCDESYPDICITPYPIDLDCDEISYSNFRVIGNDPHGFDADNDGIGCEVGAPFSSNTVEAVPECDESYPDVCIVPYPPDLNCGDIGYSNFKVEGSDPHGFDRDRDGIGCES